MFSFVFLFSFAVMLGLGELNEISNSKCLNFTCRLGVLLCISSVHFVYSGEIFIDGYNLRCHSLMMD